MKHILIGIVVLTFVAIVGVTTIAFEPSQQSDIEGRSHAGAEEIVAKFEVENMTCATCPIAVRKVMERLDGVKSVAVDYQSKTATVVFNPALVTAVSISDASTKAGYTARPLDSKRSRND